MSNLVYALMATYLFAKVHRQRSAMTGFVIILFDVI